MNQKMKFFTIIKQGTKGVRLTLGSNIRIPLLHEVKKQKEIPIGITKHTYFNEIHSTRVTNKSFNRYICTRVTNKSCIKKKLEVVQCILGYIIMFPVLLTILIAICVAYYFIITSIMDIILFIKIKMNFIMNILVNNNDK